MRDVAALAGVSVSTVSHVINETRFVEEATKQKILQAIKTLNYRPNILAQSLKGKGTRTIGVLVADIRQAFFADSIKAIECGANMEGYTIILCDSEDDICEEHLYIDILLQKRIDGLILAPVDIEISSEALLSSKLPFVQIDRKSNRYVSDFVGIDNIKSAETMTCYLLDQGYQRLGFLGYSERLYTMKTRVQGCKNALLKRGLANQAMVKELDYRDTNKQDSIKHWLLEHQDLEAVLCLNDDVCYPTIGAIEDIGRTIPHDIEVASFDEPKWFKYLSPPITVVRQPAEDIGRIAISLLLKRIQAPLDAEFQDILLSTTCIQNRSGTLCPLSSE